MDCATQTSRLADILLLIIIQTTYFLSVFSLTEWKQKSAVYYCTTKLHHNKNGCTFSL
jgi:hypothetical protein